MLAALFRSTLEVSIGGSAVVLLLFLLGRVLRRTYAAKWRYWAWALLALRLLIPVHFGLPQAPVTLTAPAQDVTYYVPTTGDTGFSVPDNVSGTERQQFEEKAQSIAQQQAQRTVPLETLLAILWAAGAVAFLLWQGVRYALFWREVRRWSAEETDPAAAARFRAECEAVEVPGRVRLLRCKKASGPMLAGFRKPALLLPAEGYGERELRAIFRHELTHFKRRDLWYKLLLLLACAVHWFNPCVWLMAREAGRDLELSCDEEALRGQSGAFREEYGRAVLSALRQETMRRLELTTCFSGGKKDLLRRLETILDTAVKRRGRAALCAVLALCVSAGMLVACVPKQPAASSETSSSAALSSLEGLAQYQTNYIGDNSKVGALLQALPLPEGVQQGELSLQTTSAPYGMTVHYTADQEGAKADLGWMYRNATLILALVDNADRVTFEMDADALHAEFTYTREQTMSREQTDIREFYKSGDMPDKFLADLYSRKAVDYMAADLNGEETAALTADEAFAALSSRFSSAAKGLQAKGMMTLGGAACYRFDPPPQSKMTDRFAVSKDGSVFVRIGADYPLVQNLESVDFSVLQADSTSAVNVVKKYLEALKNNDFESWKSTRWPASFSPTVEKHGDLGVLSLSVDWVEFADLATQHLKAGYFFSNFARSNGWSNDFLSRNMISVTAQYTVDYDNAKVPYQEGNLTEQFTLLRETPGSPWLIWTISPIQPEDAAGESQLAAREKRSDSILSQLGYQPENFSKIRFSDPSLPYELVSYYELQMDYSVGDTKPVLYADAGRGMYLIVFQDSGGNGVVHEVRVKEGEEKPAAEVKYVLAEDLKT